MMDNKYNFQKLTPINNVDMNIYKDALDFVFDNPDIKNVGISGAYSAGKSSVIETYKNLKPNINFMHISLAYFQSTNDKMQNPTEQKENVLEGKILNQLIHQIKTENIPQTNFRLKRQFSSRKLWIPTALLVLFIILIIYLFNLENWTSFVATISPTFLRKSLSWTTMPLAALSAGVLCIGILTFLIFKVFKTQFNKEFLKSISVQGNTIEIFEKSDESYFDKYLNEVLYLFENSGRDVIVFEDIDRYNSMQIFQRLREINNLINSRKNKTDIPLRFFYLLKDDIFVNKDRTKFFDFIIPIVPVLDGSNSFDQFISHFKEGKIYNIFNEQFLQEISLYIDDMRILKNIYNEFLIYHKRISTTEQDPNKLLAMIIYKNIFPRDFCNLQLNSGFVHTLFDKKNTFIDNEITTLNNLIEQLKKALEDAENENLIKAEEIDTLYIPKIQALEKRYYRDKDNDLRTLKDEHESRKENIKNKTTKRKTEIQNEIYLTERTIIELKHKKLHEIINKKNADEIFKVIYTNDIGEEKDFNDIKRNDYFPLIKYLIKNGYIDETYPDYMTYFYEYNLSVTDKAFWRSVVDENAKDYDYKLNDPAKLLTYLSDISFEQEEILNFDLLSYLLDNQNGDNKTKMIKILQQLKTSKNLKFVNLFLRSGRPKDQFVKALNSVWPLAFKEILHNSTFTEEHKKQYALDIIYHTNPEDLKRVDNENVLSNFISTHDDFLNIENPDIQCIEKVFGLLDIKFDNIIYESSNKELFQIVYQNSFYVLNYKLVCLMLNQIYGCFEDNDLKNKNYTIILSKKNEPLVEYVQENINEYIEDVVLSYCDDCISDSEETVIEVLNDKNLMQELKCAYIDNLITVIHNLKNINDTTLWKHIIECDLITYSENNILQYFFCSGNDFDDTLSEFINKKGDSFNFNRKMIDSEFGDNSSSKFFNAIVKNEKINIASYDAILRALNIRYISFSISGIPNSRMDVLINQGIIPMDVNTLSFFREQYSDKTIQLIVRNIKKYTEEIISEENFDFDETYAVLQTDVNDTYKLSLLEYFNTPISVISEAYSDNVKAYILKYNFNNSDIPHLVQKYTSFTEQLQTIIDDIVIKNVGRIISSKLPIPIQLCRKLFVLNSLDNETKLQLFAISINEFNEFECKECFEMLKRYDFLSIFSGKRPIIPITNTNKQILDACTKKHWIASYSIDKKDENMYRISSKRKYQHKSLPVEILD